MKYLLTLILLAFTMTAHASLQSAAQALGQFAWEKRQVIVFTPNAEDQRLVNFQTIQKEFSDDFAERFLQIWLIEADQQVSLEGEVIKALNPDSFYKRFDVKADEFRVVLIGYDQGEKLRQSVFNIDLLLGTIDQMPMRQQEIQRQ